MVNPRTAFAYVGCPYARRSQGGGAADVSLLLKLRLPEMWQQLIEPARGLCGESCQDVFQIDIGIVPIKLSRLDETHHCGLTPARAS
jgi:hypothetical protein